MGSDGDVTADRSRIDVGVWADVDEVGDAEGKIGQGLRQGGLRADGGMDVDWSGRGWGWWRRRAGEARGRVQGAVRGDEDVTAEVDGDGVGGLGLWVFRFCRGGGRDRGRLGLLLLAHEVAADDDVVLDDGFAGQDDVWRAVEDGATGDLVAGVLDRGKVNTRSGWGEIRQENGKKRTVSMYSPRAALLGGMAMSSSGEHVSCT